MKDVITRKVILETLQERGEITTDSVHPEMRPWVFQLSLDYEIPIDFAQALVHQGSYFSAVMLEATASGNDAKTGFTIRATCDGWLLMCKAMGVSRPRSESLITEVLGRCLERNIEMTAPILALIRQMQNVPKG